jgi:hypothetical protein
MLHSRSGFNIIHPQQGGFIWYWHCMVAKTEQKAVMNYFCTKLGLLAAILCLALGSLKESFTMQFTISYGNMWTLTKICWSQYGIFLFPS